MIIYRRFKLKDSVGHASECILDFHVGEVCLAVQNIIEVFTNCYGRFGVREAVRGAAKAGLRYVELAMVGHTMGEMDVPDEAVIGENSKESDIRSFEELLAEQGVRVISANGGGDLEDPAGVESVKRRMDLAHRLGARYFILSCGQKSEEVYKRLHELGDYALSRGLVMALETHPPLITNAEVALETMRKVNHRNVRINYDTANVHYYNENVDTLEELRTILDYVVHVHLKDSRKGFKEWYFPAIGEGTIDIPGLFKLCNDAGFFGPFSLELEGIEGEGDLPLEKRQERVARSVEYLKEIGVYA